MAAASKTVGSGAFTMPIFASSPSPSASFVMVLGIETSLQLNCGYHRKNAVKTHIGHHFIGDNDTNRHVFLGLRSNGEV